MTEMTIHIFWHRMMIREAEKKKLSSSLLWRRKLMVEIKAFYHFCGQGFKEM